jgi:hypothetical protein
MNYTTKKEELNLKFANLEKQRIDIISEQYRVQGEFRLVDEMEKAEMAKPEKELKDKK